MRALPRPRTLAILGLALLAATVLMGVFAYERSSPQPRAVPPAAATTRATPAFGVTAVETASLTAYSARVAWATTEPSTGLVQWGPAGLAPVLWGVPQPLADRHVEQLDGLAPATRYTVYVTARSYTGKLVIRDFTFETPPPPSAPSAAVVDGVLRVDGAAFLPLVVWQQCPDRWASNVADGIDLFAGSQCVGLPNLLGGVAGKALAATTWEDGAEPAGPGVLGWFYPDEADARGYVGDTLPPAPPGIRFLTLTSHFYSQAAPLPSGRGMYPGLITQADVVGFDLYPLQELCRPDALAWVFDAQRELVALAPGKPTYQWIEAREMKCPGVPVTPATVRAESWLAVAGGAQGLGFFPKDWDPAVADAIGSVNAGIRQLAPALVRPALPVEADAAGVRASARTLNGAVYVIAVNAAAAPAAVNLRVPGLGDRRLLVAATQRQLTAADGVIADTLPPLGVRIYVAPPVG
jgi:hypothetical protein